MRRQQDLPLYAGYGAPPGNGYRAPPGNGYRTSRRPPTQESKEVGRLPSLFDKSSPVVMPVGSSRQAGMGLDIKAMPTSGLPVVQTEPRLPKNMLSLSDTTADRLRQARKGYVPTSQGSRRSSIVGIEPSRKERRRNSQPSVVAPLSANRWKGNPVGHPSGYEGPRSSMACKPLPPIGGTGGKDEMEKDVCGEEEEDEEKVGGHERDETRMEYSATDSSDEEDFIDTASEAPPSRPGFESESEKSIDVLQAPFPQTTSSHPFPVTLQQDLEYSNTQRYSVTVSSTGLSNRVNNVVRAFEIHGNLDKSLLKEALNKVVKLHPLLSAKFILRQEKLYAQISDEVKTTDLEVPVVGHEQIDDLILNARRKLFPISVDTSAATPTSEADALTTVLSIASLNASAENSPTLPSLKHPVRKRNVSFANDLDEKKKEEKSDGMTGSKTLVPHLPRLANTTLEVPPEKEERRPLIRAKLVSPSSAKHLFVVSFPRIICDFWSSCLFVQQLVDCYEKLESSSNYKPSLATLRTEKKRQGVLAAYEKERSKNHLLTGRNAAGFLMKRRAAAAAAENSKTFSPMVSARIHFQQVALRERQLLLMAPKENLFAFWEAVVTTTIKRSRGMNRIKLVPPVRIPSGLGEKLQGAGLGSRGRPQTSRLRPLTASRNRPMTGRRQIAGGLGDMGMSREALLGPRSKFHFIKIEDIVCEQFNQTLSDLCQPSSAIRSEDHLRLFTMGVYILLLARCCRGWGYSNAAPFHYARGRDTYLLSNHLRQAGLDVAYTNSHEDFSENPLNSTLTADSGLGGVNFPAVGAENSPQMKGSRRKGAKLDAGTFLLGVEVSLRHSEPVETEGLFGPLSNDVGIRITLSSSETFLDLVRDLSRTLTLANRHGHHSFQPIAEEFGLVHGLPVKFSYFRHSEVVQLSNPNEYFFMDTSVGVVKKGLSRIGSHCLLMPVNSKMDDDTHLELVLWESYDLNDSLAGGLRYQPQVIRPELVELFGAEFCRLLAVVASNPSISLAELSGLMNPPFLSGHSKPRKKTARNF